jgi:hypothetical protein
VSALNSAAYLQGAREVHLLYTSVCGPELESGQCRDYCYVSDLKTIVNDYARTV